MDAARDAWHLEQQRQAQQMCRDIAGNEVPCSSNGDD
jgi:hypothetical protein